MHNVYGGFTLTTAAPERGSSVMYELPTTTDRTPDFLLRPTISEVKSVQKVPHFFKGNNLIDYVLQQLPIEIPVVSEDCLFNI